MADRRGGRVLRGLKRRLGVGLAACGARVDGGFAAAAGLAGLQGGLFDRGCLLGLAVGEVGAGCGDGGVLGGLGRVRDRPVQVGRGVGITVQGVEREVLPGALDVVLLPQRALIRQATSAAVRSVRLVRIGVWCPSALLRTISRRVTVSAGLAGSGSVAGRAGTASSISRSASRQSWTAPSGAANRTGVKSVSGELAQLPLYQVSSSKSAASSSANTAGLAAAVEHHRVPPAGPDQPPKGGQAAAQLGGQARRRRRDQHHHRVAVDVADPGLLRRRAGQAHPAEVGLGQLPGSGVDPDVPVEVEHEGDTDDPGERPAGPGIRCFGRNGLWARTLAEDIAGAVSSASPADGYLCGLPRLAEDAPAG